MTDSKFTVLGPLMGGKSSSAFLGCELDDASGQVRPVVMVFLPDEVVSDPTLLAQVVAETRVASQIDHVNVIGVWGVARLDEGTARVVEFADAESLATLYARLKEVGKTLPLPIAASVCQNACMGVHYAHELGRMEIGDPLLHGGIRPQTLLLSFQGMAKVTGYGAATLAGWLRRSRGEEEAVRDPYTAPEQIFGGRTAATIQTDVYGLGAVMYQALLGRAPMGDDAGLADALIRDDIDMTHFADTDVPDALAEIVVRAMRRKSSDRFASALDMRHAILDTGLCATEPQVRAFMEDVFPIDYPTRVARMNLLATARHKRRTEPAMRAVTDAVLPPASASAKDTVIPGSTPTPDSLLAPPEGDDGGSPLEPPDGDPGDTEASTAPIAAVTTPPTPHVVAPVAAAPVYAQPPSERVVVVKSSNTPMILLALIAGAAIAVAVVLLLREPPTNAVAVAPPTQPTPPPKEPVPEPTAPASTSSSTKSSRKSSGKSSKTSSGRTVSSKPKKPASLSITTLKGVTILIDGKNVGKTSGKAEVKPGRRKVTLVDKKRGINIYRSVRVSSGENKRMEFDIGKGELVLDAPAGATVILDGRKVGTTPVSPMDVYEGKHNVVLKKDGATFRKGFSVRPGDQVSVWAEFRQR